MLNVLPIIELDFFMIYQYLNYFNVFTFCK